MSSHGRWPSPVAHGPSGGPAATALVAFALAFASTLAPAGGARAGQSEGALDGGLSFAPGAETPGPRPLPLPADAHCEGVNAEDDLHFDPAFMGGPMVGWEWTPAASVSIDRVEIFTGETAGTSRVAVWSDDVAGNRPLAALGFSADFRTGVEKQWYGADLLTPVDVVAGTRYWVVWDPSGNEQVSATEELADIQTTYWGSPAGTVEGGASWTGPWSFTDRRWKARLYCIGACKSPSLAAGTAADVSACNDGIRLSWDAADFPDALGGSGGAGTYHVYRSQVGFADALLQPPLALDLGALVFVDADTIPGEVYHYVIQAESLDFPDCGDGPSVFGSTDLLELGPVEDRADLVAPTGRVGNALRATGHGFSSVDFEWPLAPPPGPGEEYAVFRADNDPRGGFPETGRAALPDWTDPDVPPRSGTVELWFYDVRVVDACGNASVD